MAVEVVGTARAVAFIVIGQIILYAAGRLLIKLSSLIKTTLDGRIMRASRRLTSLAILLAGAYAAVPYLDLFNYSAELREGLYYYVLLILVTLILARFWS